MIDTKNLILELTSFLIAQILFRLCWRVYKRRTAVKGNKQSEFAQVLKLYMDLDIPQEAVEAAAICLNATVYAGLIIQSAGLAVKIIIIALIMRKRRKVRGMTETSANSSLGA